MSLLLEKIRDNLIGEQQPIATPFGQKPLVYMDYTASGRSLRFVEDFMLHQVMPNYANTHSESSFTGKQMSLLREQAREQIRSAVNGSHQHKVIFCGSGASAAIDKLVGVLGIRIPSMLDERYHFSQQIPEHERAVIFIGPYEHHSNDLMWRETTARTVRIGLTPEGFIDVMQLEQELQRYADHALKIGTFSAASNVTGLKSDVAGITRLLHSYGALSFWDYAAAAPYVGIDMTAMGMDAIFMSPHKLVGGPGTPGVLVAHEHLFKNTVPVVPGGGTVDYVSDFKQAYLGNIESREEGGTPGILESIRAGIVFKLQQEVGTEVIEAKEQSFVARAIARWQGHANINLLGNLTAERLAIISFCMSHEGQELHFGFVVALLNDLFGIQARGGCSCAGPYGHRLLGIDNDTSLALEAQMREGNKFAKPGWTRMNFNYFLDEATFDYVLTAVEIIAEQGHRLLPAYEFDSANNTWNYRGQNMPSPVSLEDVFGDHQTTAQANEWDFATLLADARVMLEQAD
jgi:selenocysteine lyase/cysteine desulfurase